jgi:hypothetical protein
MVLYAFVGNRFAVRIKFLAVGIAAGRIAGGVRVRYRQGVPFPLTSLSSRR